MSESPIMRVRLCIAAGCVAFFLLLLSSGRTPIWGDAILTSFAARSLVDHRTPDVPRDLRVDVIEGRDGRFYSKYSWVPILLCVPPVLAERFLRSVKSGWVHRLAVGVSPSVRGGLVASGIAAIGLAFDIPPARLLLVSLLTLFSTPLWYYCRNYYSESAQAVLLVWLFFAALKARHSLVRPRGWLFLAGFLSGMALNTKLLLLGFAASFAVWYLVPFGRRKLSDLLLYGGLGFTPGLAAWLWLNALRYGSFFSMGYGAERDGSIGLSSPFWPGLYGLLFSSGKSIFVYAPLLLLSVWGSKRAYKRMGSAAFALVVPILLWVMVVVKWWDWSGDAAWGPRLIVPALPLMLLPLLFLGP
ncbi:MAG: hypothetical protein V1798_04490, partial [Pseudomonadota bacterium]